MPSKKNEPVSHRFIPALGEATPALNPEHTAAIKGPVVSGAVLITLGGLAVIILGSMAVAKYVQLTRLMRDLSVPAPAHEVDG